jgi:hypothetical protein
MSPAEGTGYKASALCIVAICWSRAVGVGLERGKGLYCIQCAREATTNDGRPLSCARHYTSERQHHARGTHNLYTCEMA